MLKHKKFVSLLLLTAILLAFVPALPVAADGTAADIVIVLDRSSAMSGDRLSRAREIAKSCVSAIINADSSARVALIAFDDTAQVKYHFSRSKLLLRSTVNVITRSSDGANIESGLVAASNLLQDDGRDGAKQGVILISAGTAVYYNDPFDENTLGTGILMTSNCVEQTLDQAHLTRDFGAAVVSVAMDAAGAAESLMQAIQDSGYYTGADADAIAADVLTEPEFDTEGYGTGWTVGFGAESLVPDDLPFMSYEKADLPEEGLLYSRDILSDDLSFNPSDLEGSLAALYAEYTAMSANRYPASMINSMKTFINRVLPIDPPFNPTLTAQYSASFETDLAAFRADMAQAQSALDAGAAEIEADRAAAYVAAGSTQAEAEELAAADMARLYATGSSGDETTDSAYASLRTEIDEAGYTQDYTLPNSSYYMAGYKNNLYCKGYIDETHARAAYIDDGTGRGGIVLVSVESVGMARADINRIRDSLAGFMLEHNIRAINIMSAHDHAAIDTMGIWGPILADGKDDEYMDDVRAAIATAVRSAYASRKQGTLTCGTADAGEQTRYAEELVEDTRYPIVKEHAETLTRFRFTPSDGSRELYIINFPVHLEALQGANFTLSADFLKPVQDYLAEQNVNADIMFFTGAHGGLMRTFRGQTVTDGFVAKNNNHKYYNETKIVGKRIGELILSVSDEITLAPKLNLSTTSFEAVLDNYLLALMARIGCINTRVYVKDLETGKRATASAFASEQLLTLAALNAVTTFTTSVAQGLDATEVLGRVLHDFGDTYWSMLEDNLGTCASTEMSYLEFYQQGGSRVKGVLLMPGEIFEELVYGGMLEGGTGDWSLDPHNPTAAPVSTLVSIAAAAGKDYGAENKDLIVFGLANDMIGYIVTPNDFLLDPTLPYINNNKQGDKRSHYEETNSIGPDAAYLIADVFGGLINKSR